MFSGSKPQKFSSEAEAVNHLRHSSANFSCLIKECTSHEIANNLRTAEKFQELLDILESESMNQADEFISPSTERTIKKLLFFTASHLPIPYLQEECSFAYYILQFRDEVEASLTNFTETLDTPRKLKND